VDCGLVGAGWGTLACGTMEPGRKAPFTHVLGVGAVMVVIIYLLDKLEEYCNTPLSLSGKGTSDSPIMFDRFNFKYHTRLA